MGEPSADSGMSPDDLDRSVGGKKGEYEGPWSVLCTLGCGVYNHVTFQKKS